MTYLVDVNVLVYAYAEESNRHLAARAWLNEQMNGPPQTVGLPWPVLVGYLRTVTNPRVFDRPAAVEEAWDRIEEWLSLPTCWVPTPGPRHQALLGQLIRSMGATGNLVSDAHLAALAKEHGLTVVSADSDFAKFDEVKWINPLSRQ